MALGTSLVPNAVSPRGEIVRPASILSTWITVIDPGGMTTLDAATITNPTTQITASTRHIFSVENQGTTLILRMKYDAGSTVATSPVVKVFGRTRTDAWQLLKTKALALNATITGAPTTDVTDTTWNYTTPDLSAQAWDCAGCMELIVGIETVFAGSITAFSSLQAKFI